MLTNDLDINNIRFRETIEMCAVVSTTITNTLELQPITHLQLRKHKVVTQCVDRITGWTKHGGVVLLALSSTFRRCDENGFRVWYLLTNVRVEEAAVHTIICVVKESLIVIQSPVLHSINANVDRNDGGEEEEGAVNFHSHTIAQILQFCQVVQRLLICLLGKVMHTLSEDVHGGEREGVRLNI